MSKIIRRYTAWFTQVRTVGVQTVCPNRKFQFFWFTDCSLEMSCSLFGLFAQIELFDLFGVRSVRAVKTVIAVRQFLKILLFVVRSHCLLFVARSHCFTVCCQAECSQQPEKAYSEHLLFGDPHKRYTVSIRKKNRVNKSAFSSFMQNVDQALT